MKSFKQLSKVLGISLVLVLLIIGSIWLANLDSELALRRPTATSIFPTVTLHPTVTPETDELDPTDTSTPEPNEEPSLTPTLTATVTAEAEQPSATPTMLSSSGECQYPEGWVEYTLNNQNIDVLEQLASTELSIEDILVKNCRPVNTPLTIGMKLYLPTQLPEPTGPTSTPTPSGYVCEPQITSYVYIVQHGDTLYSLANWMRISVADLKAINCLTSNTIRPGDKLYSSKPIPAPYTPTPTVTPTFTATATPTSTSTSTPTATATPELPTDTPTVTSTYTPTLTPSPDPPTATPTPTPEGGFIPTPMPTDNYETPTPTPKPTMTPIPTVTDTVEPEP